MIKYIKQIIIEYFSPLVWIKNKIMKKTENPIKLDLNQAFKNAYESTKMHEWNQEQVRKTIQRMNQPPDGEYSGSWSGYRVKFSSNHKFYEFDTKTGVRGLNVPVTVKVVDGKAQAYRNGSEV